MPQAGAGACAAAHLAGAQAGDDRAREAAHGHREVRGAHDLQPALCLQAPARGERDHSCMGFDLALCRLCIGCPVGRTGRIVCRKADPRCRSRH